MSLMPEGAPEAPQTFPVPEPPVRQRIWHSRLFGICFAIFTFEVGLFLIVFPWQDTWNLNYIQDLVPSLEDIWDDPYFRGAVTGLGLVNIYLGCLAVVRLWKRS